MQSYEKWQRTKYDVKLDKVVRGKESILTLYFGAVTVADELDLPPNVQIKVISASSPAPATPFTLF